MQRENIETGRYGETLDYLFGLQRFGIKLGLDNITALLGEFGNPHRNFPTIHIAGTNGKGSTAAFLASILGQSGLHAGLYTSPHLIDFSERIQINGKPIATERIVALTEKIRSRTSAMEKKGIFRPQAGLDWDKGRLTFFEFTTALMFLYFEEEKVDIAVIETGLGGRMDATNVIAPLAALITSVSKEHSQYLGKTLLNIAGEKAGIIKPGRPLLTSATQSRLVCLFEERCRELRSPCWIWGRDFVAHGKKAGTVDFRGRRHQWEGLRLGLAGEHQVRNAGLALAATEFLIEEGFRIDERNVRQGLAETRWPGRLELIEAPRRILLDGAHNPGATELLKRALKAGYRRKRLIAILGMMTDKDIPAMMAHLAPLADLLFFTQAKNERAAPPSLLEAESSSYEKPCRKFATVEESLAEALRTAEEEDLILITGSLYVVGEARAFLLRQGIIAE